MWSVANQLGNDRKDDYFQADIGTTGTISNNTIHILGLADDLDIIARDIRSLTTGIDSIVGVADEKALQMNISKIKYMF